MSGPSRRLAKLPPESLDAEQRATYESIAAGRRAQGPQLFQLTDSAGALEGPFNALLLQPRLGDALQALGSAVRYETTLTDRAREVAILAVAVSWQSDFEWYAHEAVGRHVGLTDDELDAIRSGEFSVLPDHTEQTVALTVHALATRSDLDDDEYAAAVEVLGLPQIFELLTLVGYYATLALQLRVFRVTAPDGPGG